MLLHIDVVCYVRKPKSTVPCHIPNSRFHGMHRADEVQTAEPHESEPMPAGASQTRVAQKNLRECLQSKGINPTSLKVLEEQEILSIRTFHAMKEEHFCRLLKRRLLSIGQHALLWEIWDEGVTGRGTFYIS